MRSFFAVRRVRLRPEYAWVHREITPGVWIRATKAATWVRQADPSRCSEASSARSRPLCDLYFEFRGGYRSPRGQRPIGE